MTKLAILTEPRMFGPRKFLMVIWVLTLVIAVYGLIETFGAGPAVYVWIVVFVISFWQVWLVRWVQVDEDGIRYRNIFQRGRELRWDDISDYREEEVRLSKHPYVVLHLSGARVDGARPIRMKLTNDQIGFETLRTIVREAVPRKGSEHAAK
ncbi:MAG: PH domain-containing protein [bacterium]|nr:PH domain-containing protein [Candidatus Kapabacteria bacterium]